MPARAAVRGALPAVRHDLPCPVSGVVQDAVTELLASGAVRRHIAAARREYAHRRRLVLAALSDRPGSRLSALDGGLHAVLELADQATAQRVISDLLRRGIRVADLRGYSTDPADPAAADGLVFGYAATRLRGYAAASDTALTEALGHIRAATANLQDDHDGEPSTVG